MHTDLDILAIRWISCIQMRHTRTPTSSESILKYPNRVCRALLLAPETGFPMVRAMHSAAFGRHSLSRMALWPTWRAGKLSTSLMAEWDECTR